jgi:micrococcal nuclease
MKFIPPVKFCRVIKVYDGDTVTIATKFPQFHPTEIYKFQVRLNGIDAPEIKGKTTEEKLAALNSRDKLHKKIINRDVELRDVGFEKYGR